MAADQLSDDARNVLRLLRERHNVILSGPPGCGKTWLLSEVEMAFRHKSGIGFDPNDPEPFGDDDEVAAWLPSPGRTNREVFSMVFDQGTKQRDLITGVVPLVQNDNSQATSVQFTVQEGMLVKAARFALDAENGGGAALLVIDEINRGPAVAVFGPSLVALEGDKRRGPDGSATPHTRLFQIHGSDGSLIDFDLPHHLYVLAAMNQADTSVEPLDVAFLRRFAPYRLQPSVEPLLAHFGFRDVDFKNLPDQASGPEDVYRALVGAWAKVNESIKLGRHDAYQIGHGVLMAGAPDSTDLQAAMRYTRQSWARIRQHIDEVFYGDARAVAEALKGDGKTAALYRLQQTSFAGQPVARIEGPEQPTDDELYQVLVGIARR